MHLSTIKRASATALAGTLATGGVLVATGTTASAVTDPSLTDYTCKLSSGPATLPATGTLALPAGSVPAGRSLKNRAVGVTVTLPQAVVAGLEGLGITWVKGSATGVAFPVGSAGSLPAGVSIPKTTLKNPAADTPLPGTGTTSSSAHAPAPGTYTVKMPKTFTFNPITNLGALPAVPCKLDTSTIPQGTLGSLKVVQATSAMSLALTNAPATHTKRAKIGVTMTSNGGKPNGSVVATMGAKKLASGTLSGGKKTLKLPLLSKGKHVIKVTYKGNASYTGTSKKITLHVH